MWNRILLTATFLFAAQVAPAQSAAELIARGDSAEAAFHSREALDAYEAAIAADTGNAQALGKASRSAVDVGEQETDPQKKKAQFALGATYARRAIAADSGNAEWHFNLSRALGRQALTVGPRDRVRYAVDIRSQALAALKIDPDHPGALHVMGMWNAEVMRLNGFERFFATKLLGGRVLGEANWPDAVKYLERAVAIDPERLSHHLDLAKIYADIGEKAKAREQYEFVINADKQTDVNDPAYKRQAESELKRLK